MVNFANAMIRKINHIPTYNICNLNGQQDTVKDITVYDLQYFLGMHADMIFPHRHSFYQLLYISSGVGRHVIDFEQYDVEQGSIYFLTLPGGFLMIQLSTQGSGRPF